MLANQPPERGFLVAALQRFIDLDVDGFAVCRSGHILMLDAFGSGNHPMVVSRQANRAVIPPCEPPDRASARRHGDSEHRPHVRRAHVGGMFGRAVASAT
jgi:hypothetical protein